MYIHLHTQTFFYVYVDRLLFYTSAMLQLYFRKKLENKRLHQNDNNTVICFFLKFAYIFEFNKKYLLTPCIWQSTLVMVCRPESKYEIEWSCLMTKKNLQQMTRAILGTIIYLHSQNTIHVHFFHDEHFFCF